MSATLQIALIEDSPGDAFWLQVILEEMAVPAHVQHFATGIEALAFFQQNPPPDLIVSDWLMPVLDFPDFVNSVRKTTGYDEIPIAVVTGADPKLYHKEAEQLAVL